MNIYSAIQNIAKEKGKSIYRIERDLDFTNGSISKWNKSVPSSISFQKVADYLSVSTKDILDLAKK
ncbi:XRE family transcriptional regulator [Fructilactobacillus vespulae]|uniref:XRE family transcriptional regulator n=1 Tax=Fructilactobacillus vespulae TaxID=1249630 RepID=UPI0039B3EAA2